MTVVGQDALGNDLETSLTLPGVPRVGDELEVSFGGGLLSREDGTAFVKVALVTWPTFGELREPTIHVERPNHPDDDWRDHIFPAIGG